MARPRKQPVSNDDGDYECKSFMTPDAQENYLVSKAFRLVERRLEDGTASSQETTHFLKLGSRANQLEIQKKEEEISLLKAKVGSIESQQRTEELYEQALSAMRRYSGNDDEVYDDEDY